VPDDFDCRELRVVLFRLPALVPEDGDHDWPECGVPLGLGEGSVLVEPVHAVVKTAPARVAGAMGHHEPSVVTLEEPAIDFHNVARPDFGSVPVKHCDVPS